jgi:pimeloyl-ACP methyl ester carboxylesterase
MPARRANAIRSAGFALSVLILTGCARPVQAGQETVAHPSKAGAVIEYFVREPAEKGPWPTVILLHGRQPLVSRPGGEAFVTWGELDRLSARGYLAVAVSLPGYGDSSGPEDSPDRSPRRRSRR